MGRVLFFLLIGLLLYAVLRGVLRSRAKPPEPDAPRQAPTEDMVTCTRCGVNMPRSDARVENDRFVCAANPHCR